MVKFCVFDTETTGLSPYLPGNDWHERNANDLKLLDYNDLTKQSSIWRQMLPSWPSLIQLGYIIYDLEQPNNSKIFSKYIDIPDDIIISEDSIKKHHIDKEKIRRESAEKKALVADAVAEFMNDIMDPDIVTVVGHNVQFDRKVIISEILRLSDANFSSETKKQLRFLMNNKNFTCSMDITTPICNIQSAVYYKDKKTGEDKVFYKAKPPKLIESYQHYFGYSPDDELLHDALIDVILTLRVYTKYKYNEDVYGKNKIITDYIIKISPEGYASSLHKKSNEVDVENIKLEIVEPFQDGTTTETNINLNTKTKKRKESSKKKSRTKRRKSKRISAQKNKHNL